MSELTSISRERWVLHYLSALDRGDIDGMQKILERAEQDTRLATMVFEAHEAYILISEVESTHSLAYNTQRIKQKRIFYPRWLAPLVALIATFALLLVTLVMDRSNGSHLQVDTIPFAQLKPITVNNVQHLRPLLTLGVGQAYDVDWSPDGKLLAVASASGVYLHSADNLDEAPTLLSGRNLPITATAFSPNGALLAGVHADEILVWDIASGRVVETLRSDAAQWASIQFNQSSDHLASSSCETSAQQAGEVCTVHIWDLKRGEETRHFAIESNWRLTLSPDWSMLAYVVAEPKSIHLVDMASGQVVATIVQTASESNSAFAFSADSHKLAVGGLQASTPLRIFEIADLVEAQANTPNPTPTVSNTFQISSELTYMAFLHGDQEVLAIDNVGSVLLHNATDGKTVDTKRINPGLIAAAALNSNGSMLASVRWGGPVRVFDLQTEENIKNLLAYSASDAEIAFSSDDHWIGTSAGQFSDTLGRLWNITDPQSSAQVLLPNSPPNNLITTTELVFRPDAESVAYLANPPGEQRGELFVRDLVTNQTQAVTEVTSGSQLAYTKAGTLMVITPDQVLTFKDLNSAPEQMHLPLPPLSVGRLLNAISPDAQLIAQGKLTCRTNEKGAYLCDNQEIQVWTSDVTRQIASLQDTGSAEFLNSLMMNADNTLLARSLCADVIIKTLDNGYSARCGGGEIHIWALPAVDKATILPSVEPFATLRGFTQVPTGLAFSPSVEDHQTLLVVHSPTDQALHFWSLNPTTGAQIALGMVGNLSDATGGLVDGVAFNSQGTLLAVSDAGQIQIWGVTD